MDIVRKRFETGGILRQSGELLDTEKGRIAQKLRNQRYLAHYKGRVFECSECNRKFSTQELLDSHLEEHAADEPEQEQVAEASGQEQEQEQITETSEQEQEQSAEATEQEKEQIAEHEQDVKGGKNAKARSKHIKVFAE